SSPNHAAKSVCEIRNRVIGCRSCGALARSRRLDGERVHAGFELVDQRVVDHAVALEPALAAKRLRHDMNSEVRLAAGTVPGMTDVPIRFVDHVEACRGEGFA